MSLKRMLQRPYFWQGFREGLALMPLWWWIARMVRRARQTSATVGAKHE